MNVENINYDLQEIFMMVSLFYLDEGAHGQAAEDGVIRGEVQESQRDAEKVNIILQRQTVVNV